REGGRQPAHQGDAVRRVRDAVGRRGRARLPRPAPPALRHPAGRARGQGQAPVGGAQDPRRPLSSAQGPSRGANSTCSLPSTPPVSAFTRSATSVTCCENTDTPSKQTSPSTRPPGSSTHSDNARETISAVGSGGAQRV